MATNKIIQTRIQQKIDTLANWQKIWGTFIPLKGEKILFQIPSGDPQTTKDNGITPPQVISKTGNGVIGADGVVTGTVLRDLPWDSALAADVAAWAKPGNAAYFNAPTEFEELEKRIPTIEHGNLTITDGTDNIVYDPTAAETVTLTGGDGVSVDVSVDVDADTNNIAIKGVPAGKALGVVKTGGVATITDGEITAITKAAHADTAGTAGEAEYASTAGSAGSAAVAGKVEHSLTLKAGDKETVYDGSVAETFEITATDLGLPNALHFLGVSTTEIKDEGTQVPTIGGKQIALADLKAGDVVLYGENEFIWTADGTNGAWEELGEASSLSAALNEHIAKWKPFSTTVDGYTNKSGNANNMLFGDNTWHGGISRAVKDHENDATEDYIILNCGSSTTNYL